ncbi:opine metallophore biosynthesis dehydrogenase [Staphylococcus edaphicus]|uniref:Opine metallophore biosynthesis dehydrogenase n=1 Tax=Staphylococcus edaphicus TaxID=1955013 RepID=A0A2C6VIT1_9STAP|nr:opine metallophore biosynthesis dehydrogenase [Staphylococcus edaphicus]PHK50131.1 hypothetical protein BTJ66_05130 [Staphylococcus edaphicus]UQW81629.1 opine metallophore biosynthesis dehydrogenase [Staphylococcus edaphicus]
MSNVLIAGTGPVAIQLACIFSKDKRHHIGMVGRANTSMKAHDFYQNYQQHNQLEVSVQNKEHQALTGQFTLHQLYADYNNLNQRLRSQQLYDTLILACQADAYRSVIERIATPILKQLEQIILISPTIGSHMMVQQQLNEINPDIEVISFSTYIGDTRVYDIEAPHQVVTTGIKHHVYIGSTKQDSPMLKTLQTLFDHVDVCLTIVATPLLAEARNSSLYVHPPLFMNEFSMRTILDGSDVPVYVYKLFPEGPITMRLIHEMRVLWQEINLILQHLKAPSLNLLAFMVKENYPVREETFNPYDIVHFESLPAIHQEYLLYVRYSSILIDPFSKPDAQGRYFDFSAVPFQQIYQDKQGVMQLPRMPYEDYYRTSIIQQIGKLLGIETPMMDRLLKRYSEHISKFIATNPELNFSKQFQLQNFEKDVNLIKDYFKNCFTLNIENKK